MKVYLLSKDGSGSPELEKEVSMARKSKISSDAVQIAVNKGRAIFFPTGESVAGFSLTAKDLKTLLTEMEAKRQERKML